MLKRPFEFSELKRPLQKMTVLYAYSEKPIITIAFNEETKKELEELSEAWDRKGKIGLLGMGSKYSIKFGETEEEYDERMSAYYDRTVSLGRTVEEYEGEIVECYVEGTRCRFFPGEYQIISKETFDHLLTCDPREYQIEIENRSFYEQTEIKNKIFYIRNRGINKDMAIRMASAEAKDNAIFRPQPAVLEMFCRSYEIY